MLGFSLLIVLYDNQFIKYAVAALAVYASVSVTFERAVPRVRALSYLSIEKGVVVAGEPFLASVTIVSWIIPFIEVSQVMFEGSSGVMVLKVRTARNRRSLSIVAEVICRVGTHNITEVTVYAKLKALAITLRACLGVNSIIRAVPKLDEVGIHYSAGSFYDVGIKSIGKPGSGTQYYMNKEYKPGDDLRRIDWKASSRTGKLAVKLFEKEVYRRVFFVVPITGRYLRGGSNALDTLVHELMKIVAELIRRGTEVVVTLVSRTYESVPSFVKVREVGDLANLAEYFSQIVWDREPHDYYLEYRSALWTSVRLLTSVIPGRSLVVYLGEPESDVDVVAGKIVANILKKMGHEPVFVLVSPEIIRVVSGEASVEDLVDLMRFSKVALSDLSLHARVTYFLGEDLLQLLLRAITI
ncbi:MAG: DUF58 domain-containing protein [Sulfolobales archaeon]